VRKKETKHIDPGPMVDVFKSQKQAKIELKYYFSEEDRNNMGESSKENVPLGLGGNAVIVAPAFAPAVLRVCLPKRCASLFVAEALRKYENLLENRNKRRLVLFCSLEQWRITSWA